MLASKQVREIARLAVKMVKASEARRSLPPGSSRARVTTTNARWANACEAFERSISDIAGTLGASGAEHLRRFIISNTER